MKRVLVTGAGGFVGARILDMWRGKFALCAFPSDTLRTADENAVLRFILKEHPDVIVHTAALSNTQYCQQEPEDSFRANVLLPGCCGSPSALDVRPPGLSSAHPGQPAAEHPESGKDR